MVKSKEIQDLENQAANDRYWFELGKKASRNIIRWDQVLQFGLVFFLLGLSVGVIAMKYFPTL